MKGKEKEDLKNSALLQKINGNSEESIPDGQKKETAAPKSDAAEENGSAAERIKELETELKKLLIREEQRKADYEAKVKAYELNTGKQAIMKEAEETAKKYKNFDFDKELENQTFVNFLKSGLDVTSAYEAAHLDEIKAALQRGSKADELKKRPLENGTGKGGGALLKSGVYALTRKEREELARRTQRGETIRF